MAYVWLPGTGYCFPLYLNQWGIGQDFKEMGFLSKAACLYFKDKRNREKIPVIFAMEIDIYLHNNILLAKDCGFFK